MGRGSEYYFCIEKLSIAFPDIFTGCILVTPLSSSTAVRCNRKRKLEQLALHLKYHQDYQGFAILISERIYLVQYTLKVLNAQNLSLMILRMNFKLERTFHSFDSFNLVGGTA